MRRRSKAIRVLIVDDHPVVRDGLSSRLDTSPGITVVGQAGTGVDALAAAERLRPDVVLLDLSLPDLPGPYVCSWIVEHLPGAAVVILTAFADDDLVRASLEAGARSYLLKDDEGVDVVDAVHMAHAGESMLARRATEALLRRPVAKPDTPVLSERELEVLRFAARGFSNASIGDELHLSVHTVKEYLGRAMRKLEVASRTTAVLEATRLGLLDAGREAGETPRSDPRGVSTQAPPPGRP